MRVAFIGLGAMGLPMARNLIQAGHDVQVYNRSPGPAQELADGGARLMDSPAEAAGDAEALLTMLSDDAALEAVLFGEGGAFHTLPVGSMHISMSTVSVAMARRLTAAHATAGQQFVSAPVFGRPEAAADARLWVVAAGAPGAVERCRPLLEAVSQGLFVVGVEPEKANLVKIAGNFTIVGVMETLGEAFALLRKSGVDPHAFLELLNGALYKSPIYESYGRLIAAERYEPAGFKLSLGLKDVRLALAAADEANVPMPLASLARDRYLSALAHGEGELDWSALARGVARDAGLVDP